MMAAARARGLMQRFGRRFTLGPLDLELASKERLAVLGDNGAGKTTLLRLLATADRPAAGSLEVLGLDAVRERDRLRPRIGFLGHQTALCGALTARENLELFAGLWGLRGERVGEALAEAGLADVAGVRADRLSRGQQQRLALARAALHRPELLVLDEPDASLDEKGRELLGWLLEDRTAVLATHDRALARRLCDRALLLRAGRDVGDPWAVQVLEGGV